MNIRIISTCFNKLKKIIVKFFEPSNIVVGKKITDTFLKTNYRV